MSHLLHAHLVSVCWKRNVNESVFYSTDRKGDTPSHMTTQMHSTSDLSSKWPKSRHYLSIPGTTWHYLTAHRQPEIGSHVLNLSSYSNMAARGLVARTQHGAICRSPHPTEIITTDRPVICLQTLLISQNIDTPLWQLHREFSNLPAVVASRPSTQN